MPASCVQIRELPQHIDEEVVIRGWMYNKRSSGKIHFLQLRDGSGFVQAVMAKSDVAEKDFENAKNLWFEACLEVTGKVRADQRAPSGVELSVTALKVFHNPTEEYHRQKRTRHRFPP